MGDIALPGVPLAWWRDLFQAWVDTHAVGHTHYVLTKHPAVLGQVLSDLAPEFPQYWDVMGRVVAMTTVENQKAADLRVPALLEVPALQFGVSAEPLLGRVTLKRWLKSTGPGAKWIDWVIVGGQSGPNAQPMHPNWARGLRDECKAYDVDFFFKQWGAWTPRRGTDEDSAQDAQLFWDGTEEEPWYMENVGKKYAGKTLDNAHHLQVIDRG